MIRWQSCTCVVFFVFNTCDSELYSTVHMRPTCLHEHGRQPSVMVGNQLNVDDRDIIRARTWWCRIHCWVANPRRTPELGLRLPRRTACRRLRKLSMMPPFTLRQRVDNPLPVHRLRGLATSPVTPVRSALHVAPFITVHHRQQFPLREIYAHTSNLRVRTKLQHLYCRRSR